MAITATTQGTDEMIQRAVLEELVWDDGVGPNGIDVIVNDEVVTLRGWVDAYSTKWAADTAARRADGVRTVVDEMEVRRPGSPRRPDAGIAGDATRAVDWDTVVPVERMEITGLGVNLYEQDYRYTLQVPLPCAKPDQLAICARGNTVTLQGTIEFAAPQGARAVFQNAGSGQFREQIELPGDAAAEHASALYRDGVLTLTLPKVQHAAQRTIPIRLGNAGDPGRNGVE